MENKKIFYAIVGAIVVFIIIITATAVIMKGDKVGDYYFSHTTYTEEVYRICTPRGWEYVVGKENLFHSLQVYEENGILGTPLKELKKND